MLNNTSGLGSVPLNHKSVKLYSLSKDTTNEKDHVTTQVSKDEASESKDDVINPAVMSLQLY